MNPISHCCNNPGWNKTKCQWHATVNMYSPCICGSALLVSAGFAHPCAGSVALGYLRSIGLLSFKMQVCRSAWGLCYPSFPSKKDAIFFSWQRQRPKRASSTATIAKSLNAMTSVNISLRQRKSHSLSINWVGKQEILEREQRTGSSNSIIKEDESRRGNEYGNKQFPLDLPQLMAKQIRNSYC